MDYGKIIELDNITKDDCINLYVNNGLRLMINDGVIVNLVDEGMDGVDRAYYYG